MNTFQAHEKARKHMLIAKSLCTTVECVGRNLRTRHKKNPKDPTIPQTVRVLVVLTKKMADEVELTRLYQSFAMA